MVACVPEISTSFAQLLAKTGIGIQVHYTDYFSTLTISAKIYQTICFLDTFCDDEDDICDDIWGCSSRYFLG